MSSDESYASPSPEPKKRVRRKPAKRAKMKKGEDEPSKKATAKRRGKQGSLSVLPTLPMDLLYEIFAHISFSDLLNLARTTKSFRNTLMSRQSAFLWRSVLESDEAGYPPCPEDMNEPAWADLLCSGGRCGICGSKTSKDILWAIRKRLCKTCQGQCLISVHERTRPPQMDPHTKWMDVLPWDCTERFERRLVASRVVLRDDKLAYIRHLQALVNTSDDFVSRRNQLDKERKAKMDERQKHAEACYEFERQRSIQRAGEIDGIRQTRFEQIKEKLLELGYDTVDIDSVDFQCHPEVRTPKPVTDRIWKRLGPITLKLVEDIRDRRLRAERSQRRRDREAVVETEYNDTILHALPWSLVSLVPSLYRVWEQTGLQNIKELLEHDMYPTDEFRVIVRQTLFRAVPAIQQAIMVAADEFRTALPYTWASKASPTPGTVYYYFDHPEFTLDLSSLETLDRAAFVFRCRAPKGDTQTAPIHFGLDTIAHRRGHLDELPLEPEHGLHALVLQLLELLELDPATTTPMDIDKLAPVFICTDHSVTSSIFATGVPVFTNWRDAVVHGDKQSTSCPHRNDPPCFRLASDLEARYVRATVAMRSGRKQIWGCCHCIEHLQFRTDGFYKFHYHLPAWKFFSDIKAHLKGSHDLIDVAEGRDYYYDRRDPVARFEDRFHGEPVYLPIIPAGELEAQVLAKELSVAGVGSV